MTRALGRAEPFIVGPSQLGKHRCAEAGRHRKHEHSQGLPRDWVTGWVRGALVVGGALMISYSTGSVCERRLPAMSVRDSLDARDDRDAQLLARRSNVEDRALCLRGARKRFDRRVKRRPFRFGQSIRPSDASSEVGAASARTGLPRSVCRMQLATSPRLASVEACHGEVALHPTPIK
jgi:hypothetical protein